MGALFIKIEWISQWFNQLSSIMERFNERVQQIYNKLFKIFWSLLSIPQKLEKKIISFVAFKLRL